MKNILNLKYEKLEGAFLPSKDDRIWRRPIRRPQHKTRKDRGAAGGAPIILLINLANNF